MLGFLSVLRLIAERVRGRTGDVSLPKICKTQTTARLEQKSLGAWFPGYQFRSPREPRDDCKHTKPAQISRNSPDALVVLQHTPLPKQNFPVVIAGAHQRQLQSTGVGHVRADVQKIFEEPEAAKSYRGELTLPEEIEPAQQWHDQFAQRSAKNSDH